MLVILPSEDSLNQIVINKLGMDTTEPTTYTTLQMNYEGTEKNREAFLNALKSTQDEISYYSSDDYRLDMESLVGGFLFLGFIFGLTFTLATSIIIYYKQVSEGLQDKARFNIMQRVGMSRDEVKHTIRSQILMVFFLPILLACLHLTFAFPSINKLLQLFDLNNTPLMITTSIIMVISFFVIYLLMYFRTSKTYYRIVER